MTNEPAEAIQRLTEYIQKKAKQAEPEAILAGHRAAAELMEQQMRGRSSPRRKRSNSHMLDNFVYESHTDRVETEFGWNRQHFYGRIVESGWNAGGWAKKRMPKRTRIAGKPHLKPTFEANRKRVLETMISEIERKG